MTRQTEICKQSRDGENTIKIQKFKQERDGGGSIKDQPQELGATDWRRQMIK